jgi:hypothetical protein
LRAEFGRDELERGMGIIVEPPDQPGVHPVIYPQHIEPRTDLMEEAPRLGIQKIGKGGSVSRDALVGLFL